MSERETRQVVLERRAAAEGVQLSVADSGPGIPAGHRETIFDPFFTTKAPGEGTGLGLAVSKAMMEAMGGSLDIDPGDRDGATFVLVLPLGGGQNPAQ